ncbi:hypothetical protein N6H18_05525 [Reichenbachiella agarivorans]|uniref:Lipoprotein n=1 Tax=Reichenbachiella agarivorans TaxID=2979464 RepID=A0ABY6CSB0_9BACT|nr:hypothetical protein [Reichenbachiella agarivorans]UXP33411.1 hypothetical protein N6H18_05525 [Reichenbachiella agarivorans]
MKNLLTYGLVCLTLFFTSCLLNREEDEKPKGEDVLNEEIILPAGSFSVDDDQLTRDPGLTISSGTSSAAVRVEEGQTISASITFSSADANVTHAGIRFGNSGKSWLIPISAAKGYSSGTLSFSMGIPSGLCDQIKSICHDVKCYEFAVASAGGSSYRISNENINELVLGCGACDDSSCKELAVGCSCDANTMNADAQRISTSLSNLSGDIDQLCSFFYSEFVPWYDSVVDCLSQSGASQTDVRAILDSYKTLKDTYDDLCSSARGRTDVDHEQPVNDALELVELVKSKI